MTAATTTRTPRWIALLPNALGVFRVACAAAFPMAPEGWRLGLVLAGGLSDLLDGAIARRFDVGSPAGALLDAVADKLLVLSVLLTLAATGAIAWWQVALVLARDGAVAIAAGWTAIHRRWEKFREMTPRWTGKLATALIFAWLVIQVAELETLATWLFAGAAASSVVAAVDYLRVFVAALRVDRRST